MLKSLRIRNFQNHKDSFIEFSPRLTVITGYNGNGKSVIFRALMKVIRNQPAGQFFIRDGTTDCRLDLCTEVGTITRAISKTSSAKSNLYCIDGREDKTYVKFGINIPEEIVEALGVSPEVRFGDTFLDLNFQVQLKDQPFLVFGQGIASLRGKVLSKVTGVDIIQRAIQVAGTFEKRRSSLVEQRQQEIEKSLQTLKTFDYLNTLADQHVQIESLYKSVAEKQAVLQELRDILESVQKISMEARRLRDFIKKARAIQSSRLLHLNSRLVLLELCLDANPIRAQYALQIRGLEKFRSIMLFDVLTKIELQQLYLSAVRIQQVVGIQAAFINSCAVVVAYWAKIGVNDKLKLSQEYGLMYAEINSNQVDLNAAIDRLRALDIEMDDTKKELYELRVILKVCPTCGKSLLD